MTNNQPSKGEKEKYEYSLRFWGGSEKTILKELGYKGTPYTYYFDNKEERESMKQSILKYQNLGLVWDESQGVLTHKMTVANVKLGYKGKEYSFKMDYSFEYPKDSVRFMFEDGNYSCDCNRSLFIQQYCDDSFPKMECGDEIQLLDLDVTLEERENL